MFRKQYNSWFRQDTGQMGDVDRGAAAFNKVHTHACSLGYDDQLGI